MNDLLEPDEVALIDHVWARRAVHEGDAMLAQLAYARRHDVAGLSAERYRHPETEDSRGSWPMGFSRTNFYSGTRYLRATNGTARNVAVPDPPETTRLLLHPNATPANRSLRLPSTLADDRYAGLDHDRIGELAVRRALVVTALPHERAAAATGWRDGYASVYHGRSAETGAWRTRWANTSEASEFLIAYRDALGRLNATRADGMWRVATPTTPETFYRVEQTNAMVTIVAGPNRTSVRGIAAVLPTANATAGS